MCKGELLASVKGIPGGGCSLIGYIGMCAFKEYGFTAVLDMNRISLLADFGPFWS